MKAFLPDVNLKGFFHVRLTREIGVRLLADSIMLLASLILAIILRLFYLIVFENAYAGTDYKQAFWQNVDSFLKSALPFVPFALIVFALNGLYARGRAYYFPYKAFVVVRAVSLAFLGYVFLLYFLVIFATPESALLPRLPRGVWLVGWLITLFAMITSRLWSAVWREISWAEHVPTAESESTRRILVIGGAGYIGSALLPKLLNAGYRVRLLDLLLFGMEPIAEVADHPNLEMIQGDLRQVDKVVEAMQGVDAVIHLGAIVGDPACALNEQLTIDINLSATRMIAEVAKACRVKRFIFASTCSVYGASDELLDEHSTLSPVSLYARSKISSERVLLDMADDRFHPVILRFATIYGISGRTRFDLVVNLLAAKAVVDGHVTVFGGHQWRPFVHVDDAALAILKALEAPLSRVDSEIFNVGSDEQNYTIQQVGEIVNRLVPSARLVSEDSKADRRNYRVSFAKVRNALAFKPNWTIERGVQQVLDAICTGKVENYRDARYSNVKFMNEEGGIDMLQSQVQLNWAQLLIAQAATEIDLPGNGRPIELWRERGAEM